MSKETFYKLEKTLIKQLSVAMRKVQVFYVNVFQKILCVCLIGVVASVLKDPESAEPTSQMENPESVDTASLKEILESGDITEQESEVNVEKVGSSVCPVMFVCTYVETTADPAF